MNWNRRPSRREIDKKIFAAREALSENRGYFGPIDAKLVGEFMDLEIGDSEEVWPLILELLKELEIDDYAGSHPPQRSDERKIADCELFAFSWMSKKLQKEMYLKFALKENNFYYVSLHESRKNKFR